MVNNGVSGITVNATLSALKFLFQVTLDKPEVIARIYPVTVARKLPIVLSLEETTRFMAMASHPKFKAAFAVAYGAGLRVSEVVSLKVSDIDKYIRRFLLHVLPSGFHRIRHYGLTANTGRKKNLAKARQLLNVNVPTAENDKKETDEAKFHEPLPTFVCPCCGAGMEVTEVLPHLYLPRAPPLLMH